MGYILLVFLLCVFFKKMNFVLIVPILLVYHVVSLHFMFDAIRLKTVISIFVLIYSINLSISSIICMVFYIPYNLPSRELISLLVSIVLLILCLILSITQRVKIKNPLIHIPAHIKRLTMSSVVLSAFMIHLISDYNTFESIEKFNTLIKIVLTLLMLCIGLAFPLMIANFISKSLQAKQSESYKQQIKAQAEHYAALAKSNNDIRRFKHDYNNLRIAVAELMKIGKTSEALGLLNTYDDSINGCENLFLHFDTGNGIADALLSEKQRRAIVINTVIEFDGCIPTDKIAPEYLCIVLGNILDNAIEASEKIVCNEIKNIKVICRYTRGYMFIKVMNPVSENVKIIKNFIPSTKTDKLAHGFGLYSLNKIVKKYDGKFDISCENNIFYTNIALPIGI